MDTTDDGRKTVLEVQESLLGPQEIAGTGETKEERKRRKNNESHVKCYWKRLGRVRPRKNTRKLSYEEQLAANRERWSQNREKYRITDHVYYMKNREQILEGNRDYQRHWTQKWRLATMQAYGGPICKCCGETELKFLSIDHINGGGSKHRKEYGVGGGKGIYRWLAKNNYPPGFQVLCHNCNLAKGFYGSCPHTQIATPVSLFLELN
jgi:hypothetical protein